MIEYLHQPEFAVASLEAMGILAMAFSIGQRRWFKERDKHRCQAHAMGIPHDCNGHPDLPQDKRRLQVHHILPQRYCKAVGIQTADFPENGITLCEQFHQREIHPDMKDALTRYRSGDKGSFQRVGINRDQMISQGVIYWNSAHDRRLSAMAIRNTQRATKPFPTKYERKQKS